MTILAMLKEFNNIALSCDTVKRALSKFQYMMAEYSESDRKDFIRLLHDSLDRIQKPDDVQVFKKKLLKAYESAPRKRRRKRRKESEINRFGGDKFYHPSSKEDKYALAAGTELIYGEAKKGGLPFLLNVIDTKTMEKMELNLLYEGSEEENAIIVSKYHSVTQDDMKAARQLYSLYQAEYLKNRVSRDPDNPAHLHWSASDIYRYSTGGKTNNRYAVKSGERVDLIQTMIGNIVKLVGWYGVVQTENGWSYFPIVQAPIWNARTETLTTSFPYFEYLASRETYKWIDRSSPREVTQAGDVAGTLERVLSVLVQSGLEKQYPRQIKLRTIVEEDCLLKARLAQDRNPNKVLNRYFKKLEKSLKSNAFISEYFLIEMPERVGLKTLDSQKIKFVVKKAA